MYKLNRTSLAPEIKPGSEADIACRRAADLIADASAGLRFEHDEHRYFLGERELHSVSSIVEWFAPFDSLGVAKRCSRNERHEMFGKEPEEIVAIWEQRANEAAEAGTQMHEFGEACYLLKTGRETEIDAKYWDRIDNEGLEASNPKEEAIARWWDNLDLNRFIPVAKESRICNPVNGYAGTFDLLFWDRLTRSYALKDYKSNKDLFKWYGEHLRAPLTPIKKDDAGKYTLQQNMYRISLVNLSLNVGSMELIWARDDSSYQTVVIPEYEKLVRFALNTLIM